MVHRRHPITDFLTIAMASIIQGEASRCATHARIKKAATPSAFSGGQL